MSSADAQASTKREIEVEVPGEEVARETELLVQKYCKLARIPGFRRGHVPASIIRQRFADDIRNEVIDTLIPRYFRKETERLGLLPISEPRVSRIQAKADDALSFKASFEVMPEIRAEGYRELRAEHTEISVSDQDVADAVRELQEEKATFSPVEGRPVRDGDYAQVSFRGLPRNEEAGAKPVEMEDVLVEIGGAKTMPEFTENLRASSAGEERNFDVVYPQDFSDERLRGKTFHYQVKVKAVKQKSLPELNDDFARELGEFSTLADVRRRIRERIEAERRQAAERQAKDKLLAELIRRNDFEVPRALIERQINLRLERGLRALALQGMKSEDVRKLDLERLRAGQQAQALQEVKAGLLLDKIAEQEKISVADEEIDREIEALASQTNQAPETIRARLTRDGALDRIRSRIRSEKALDFLYRQSA